MSTFSNLPQDTREELIEMVAEELREGYDGYGCDLHNEVFNTDYFIIGRYKAEQWLEKNVGVFSAIEAIKEYETSNFGEVTTDLSSAENVCNMFVYIAGEELLSEIDALNECWDRHVDEDDRAAMLEELENL